VGIHYVNSIEEVLDIALPRTSAEEKQDEIERDRVLTQAS
jgi:hypothetical protein